MEGKEEENKKKKMSSLSETQQLPNADLSRGKRSFLADSESFYNKLTNLLDSTGLTLIFNVRQTSLDLHLFYLEVTTRGGYHQVGQEKKWGEVVSALKLEGSNAKLSAQLKKLYAHLLYRFEKLYFYRSSPKQSASGSTKGSLKRKQNSMAGLSQLMDDEDDQKVTNISEECSSQMTELPVLLPASSNDKEMTKRRGAPMGHRSAYHIFIKQECARLKTRQELDRPKILSMAVNAWRNMSEIEKQPYVEESKKNKEKFKEAMITDGEQHIVQGSGEEKRPSLCGDYYCVTSQPQADYSLANKAAVDLALKMTEKAPKESFFLVDWDA